MKEILKWLGYILWMKDDRWPKIVLVGQPSRVKRKEGCPTMALDIAREELREIGTSGEGVKREALNRLRFSSNSG